jgi:hypothetical protein
MRNPHKSADRFKDDREALDFIASRIADEAQLEGVPLSEVERKMLYFSETAWTLPDIWEVSDEFGRDYDSGVYERKISQLIKRAVGHAQKLQKEEFEAWDEAIDRLSRHDRYLMVMVRQAGFRTRLRSPRARHKMGKILERVSAATVLLGSLVWFISERFPDTYVSPLGIPRTTYASAIWAVVFGLAVLSSLLRVLVGAEEFDKFSDRIEEWIFGISKRAK